ncbi:MAG: SGNH/GDSL hydrolase family protein [Clostridia bacterium]|nr:SGNH/GDSL hydrolase family protein [Clostridia bacterium]
MNFHSTSVLKEIISHKENARVKLLGDSITHGVGGSGFAQNGEPIVTGFARSPHSYCWANLLRDHLKEKYGCEVINNACTGRDIEFIIANFDKLVDAADDIVICTIGTNNRHQYFRTGERIERDVYLNAFRANIVKLYGMFKEAGKQVIFMANIPASEQNERDGEDYWRIFHMNDVNDAYKSASTECGFSLISLYELFVGYCRENGIHLDCLRRDGLHPNDEGYKVMFELLLRAFDL